MHTAPAFDAIALLIDSSELDNSVTLSATGCGEGLPATPSQEFHSSHELYPSCEMHPPDARCAAAAQQAGEEGFSVSLPICSLLASDICSSHQQGVHPGMQSTTLPQQSSVDGVTNTAASSTAVVVAAASIAFEADRDAEAMVKSSPYANTAPISTASVCAQLPTPPAPVLLPVLPPSDNCADASDVSSPVSGSVALAQMLTRHAQQRLEQQLQMAQDCKLPDVAPPAPTIPPTPSSATPVATTPVATPPVTIPRTSPYPTCDVLLNYSAPAATAAPSQPASQHTKQPMQTQQGAPVLASVLDSVDRDASTIGIPSHDFSLPFIMPRSSMDAQQPPTLSIEPKNASQDVFPAPDNVLTVPPELDAWHGAAAVQDACTEPDLGGIPALKGAQREGEFTMFPGLQLLQSSAAQSRLQQLQSPTDASQNTKRQQGDDSGSNNTGASQAALPGMHPLTIPPELSPGRQRSLSGGLSSHICSRVDNPSCLGSSEKIPSCVTSSSNPWPECLFPATKPPVSANGTPPLLNAANRAIPRRMPHPSDTSLSESERASTRMPPMVKFQFLPGGSAAPADVALPDVPSSSNSTGSIALRSKGGSRKVQERSVHPSKAGRWPGSTPKSGVGLNVALRMQAMQAFAYPSAAPTSASSTASTAISRSIAAAGEALQRKSAAATGHYNIKAPETVRNQVVVTGRKATNVAADNSPSQKSCAGGSATHSVDTGAVRQVVACAPTRTTHHRSDEGSKLPVASSSAQKLQDATQNVKQHFADAHQAAIKSTASVADVEASSAAESQADVGDLPPAEAATVPLQPLSSSSLSVSQKSSKSKSSQQDKSTTSGVDRRPFASLSGLRQRWGGSIALDGAQDEGGIVRPEDAQKGGSFSVREILRIRSRTSPAPRASQSTWNARLEELQKTPGSLNEAGVERSRSSRRVAESGDSANAEVLTRHPSAERSRSNSSSSSIQSVSATFSSRGGSGQIASGAQMGCFPCRKKASGHGSGRRMHVGAQSTGGTTKRRCRCPLQETGALVRRMRMRGSAAAAVRRQTGCGASRGSPIGMRRGPFSGWLQRRFGRGGGVQSSVRARPQNLWRRKFRKLLSMRVGRQRTSAMHGPAERLHSESR